MSEASYLEVHSMTWNRDTHGLFDYEAKSLSKRVFKEIRSCKISRIQDECYIVDKEIIPGSADLLNIEQRGSEFLINNPFQRSSSKMWLVIREIKAPKPKGYKLNEGDWLKLGRIKLRVQKIVLQPLKVANDQLPPFFQESEIDETLEKGESANETEKAACRICLNDQATPEDPLICPCKCAGTMKYIHLNCLKEWLKSKFTSKVSDKGMSFHLKDLNCELCKTDFPSCISHNEQKINLLNINYPTKSYIILEEYRPDNNQKQGVHLISLDDGQFGVLGRGHDCDIKITDISVSRKHCKVRLNGDEFYVEDTKSKFGTLAKLKKSFMIRANYDLSVQVNRTVFRLIYKEPVTCKSICDCFSSGKVMNANLSYLTQPGFIESESEAVSHQPSSRVNNYAEMENQ